jgi:cytochrome c553
MKINLKTSLVLFAGPVIASVIAAFVIFALVSVANSAVAQDAVAGENKYVMCAACHGAQGQGGVGSKLAGQPLDDIVKKLTAYANKEELGPQSQMMWGISATLTSADISNLAAYIATLK